jgi:hypothetical protein
MNVTYATLSFKSDHLGPMAMQLKQALIESVGNHLPTITKGFHWKTIELFMNGAYVLQLMK